MKAAGLNIRGKVMAVAVLVALILLADHVGLFNGPDNHFYDLFFRIRGSGEPAKKIVVIAIDDKTLSVLGRWPIRRLHYASLLTRLKEAHIVAFDIIMSEPSGDDEALEAAVRAHGRVVFPAAVGDKMTVIFPVIRGDGGKVGHIHLEQGIDGVVREAYHTLVIGATILPSFSSLVFEEVTGKTFSRAAAPFRHGPKAGIIQQDKMSINYSGGPGAFERISFSDVLEGAYPPKFFRNKICLVGVTAVGAAEILLTPFSEERKGSPGVVVHANALYTLLTGSAIQVIPPWVRWLFTAALAFLSFPFFLRMTELKTVILAFLMLLCFTALVFTIFSAYHVWFAPTGLSLTIVGVFAMSYVFRFREAVGRLDRAYASVVPHLRDQRGRSPETSRPSPAGVKGLLTPGGVYSKAQVLGEITDRLVFEKDLADAAVFSDVQGVLLFGPGREKVLINNMAASLCSENGIPTDTVDAFAQGLAGFMADRDQAPTLLERICHGAPNTAFHVSFPSPAKNFFKVDTSLLTIGGKEHPLFVFSDITAIKELEILKGHVVSLVSHEIRTPLTSIEGFGELLQESLEGEPREYADIIRNESGRLLRFLNVFLDISRIEEGRQPIRTTAVVLSDVAGEVALELKALAEEKGITIRLEAPGELSPVTVDRDLTKQCIINLVENAIKYSPDGTEIIMKVREDADNILTEVVDRGVGIREEDRERVFEKFYRVRSADTKDVRGSGLGLTFVKEAVGVQGGKVLLQSRYGEGSTFTIVFPGAGRRERDEKDTDRR